MAIALRYLELPEMLALSAEWLGSQRASLDKIPELSALLPRLAEAHQGLARLQAGSSPTENERTQQILAEAKEVDDRHDHAVRALYFALSAAISYHLADESPDIDMVTHLEVLRDLVLPEGLATTQATYEAEAGMAARAAEAVASDPEAQKLLHHIHLLPRVTGVDLLSVWSDLGNKLGALDLQRAAAEREQGSINPAKLRNDWLNIVASMLSVLDVTRSAEARRVIKEPLEKACTQAARRYNASRKKKKK